MAHNISTASGRPETFHYGDKPWHGLGVELDHPATAAEAIDAAGLTWNVQPEPIFLQDGKPVGEHVRAIVRQDTRKALGVATDRYIPIQNRDAFGFFDAVVGQGQAIYHTAGALGQGERIWILAKLPGELRIDGTDDVSEKYLLLVNHHDGKHALRAFPTTVRVVCQNTLHAAITGVNATEGVCIRHTGEIRSKVAEAQRVLGLTVKYYDTLSDVFNVLAKKQATRIQAEEYVKKLIPDPKDGKGNTRAGHIRQDLLRLFETGRGNTVPGIRGSVWALVNGVSEYVSHYRTPRISKATGLNETTARASARLNALWFGSGRELNERAFAEARGLAGLDRTTLT